MPIVRTMIKEGECMKFAVLGLGRTGQAAVCYLKENGQTVIGWDRNTSKVDIINKNGIEATGVITGHYQIPCEHSLENAVSGVQYILVFTTAEGHKSIANQLKGLLRENQRIIVFNGNWGATEFVHYLGNETSAEKIIVAETGAQIFASPLNELGKCFLKSMKKKVTLGSFPCNAVEGLIEELKELFPQFSAVSNVLETTLNMSNPLAHCPLDLFNLSRIDSGEETLMFASNYTSPMGVKFVEAVDRERINLLNQLGVKAKSLLDLFNFSWDSQYDDLYVAFKSIPSYQTAKSPTNFSFRHFTEDLPFGIEPIRILAQKYHVATPNIDAMMSVYNAVLGNDNLSNVPEILHFNLEKLME